MGVDLEFRVVGVGKCRGSESLLSGVSSWSFPAWGSVECADFLLDLERVLVLVRWNL